MFKYVRNGFTVVELLIVVTVVAIIAGIVVVGYQSVIRDSRKTAASHFVKSVSNKIRTEILANSSVPASLNDLGDDTADSDIDHMYITGPGSGRSQAWCLSARHRDGSFYTASYEQNVKEGGCTYPGENNKALDFRLWRTNNPAAVSYDSDSNELVGGNVSGTITQPLIDVSGSTSVRVIFDFYATTPSPNSAPQGSTHLNAFYFAEDGVTPVYNNHPGGPYTSNGDTRSAPLGAWTTLTHNFVTGPNVKKIRISINNSPSSWTGTGNRIKNIQIIALN